MLAVPDDLITHEFTRQFLGEEVPRGVETMRRPEVIEAERRAAALDGPWTAELVGLAFEDPATLRSRFVRLINDYWNEAFATEWERIEPVLAGSVAAYGQLIASRGFFSLLEPLWPEVRLDRPARTTCRPGAGGYRRGGLLRRSQDRCQRELMTPSRPGDSGPLVRPTRSL